MSIITIDQFNDDGTTTRSAGEVFTINGGTITFRTDSRRSDAVNHSFGGNAVISPSLGGGIVIDGRNVRWLPVSASTGTATIGAVFTQGSVSGVFLGFWANLTSRGSTTLGGAGFIKFREVTGGTFTAGALTGTGIIATASEPDVVGWLEIVADQSANFNIPRLGSFTTHGNWFELGTTTGAAGQIIQTPTNGGGSATEAPGVWIETGVGTNVYNFFPSLKATTQFTSANLSTDARSKFVHNMLGGQVRIGSDGTTNIGFVPPAGCRIRIPNVIYRQCTTGARQTNTIPHATLATRPDFTTTSAGVIDLNFFYGDWHLSFAQPYSVRLNNVASFDNIVISECATPVDLRNGGAGMSQASAVPSLQFISCFAGGTIEDWHGPRGSAAAAGGHNIDVQFCSGLTFNRVQAGILILARNATGYAWNFNQCSNITLNNCSSSNQMVFLNTCIDVRINNHDHVDRYVGTTNTTTGLFAVSIANSCVNVTVNGMSFGRNNTIANCHPHNGIVNYAGSSKIKVRNIGTRTAFLNGGSANAVNHITSDAGNNNDIRIQRCYMVPTRTSACLTNNSSRNVIIDDVYGDWVDAVTLASFNVIQRGGGGTNTVTGQTSVYGTHFGSAFTSDTTGRIWLALNEPTAETLPFTSRQFSPKSGFTSVGGLSLAVAGDFFTCEMQSPILQVTGFANIAPTITGTNPANHTFEYQLNVGGTWGVWRILNAANLSSEVITPDAGFKMRFRITCTVSNTANLVSFVRIDTTSTLLAQTNNLYPLDINTVTLTDLFADSEVRAYIGTDPATAVEIAGVESSGTSFVFSHSNAGQQGFIVIFSMNRQTIRLPITFVANDISIPIQQVIDRVFENAA